MDVPTQQINGQSEVPQLAFSEKYDQEKADLYFRKHEDGFIRAFSNRREIRMARRALAMAGHPWSVLDIPCGTGRFWEMLTEDPSRVVFAADLNAPMLGVATQRRPADAVARVKPFLGSAFSLPCADGFVDAVFCMRLIHHMRDSAHRIQLIQELARVASKTVIISLWVDRNFQAWRRRKMELRKPPANRFIVPRTVIENEFHQCGLAIKGHVDFLRYYSMWTTYVLVKAAPGHGSKGRA